MFPVVWFEIDGEFGGIKPKKADVLDFSHSGIGLSTLVPLEPGQVIRFSKRKKYSDLLPEAGRVMWTSETSEGCNAGVMFTDL